MAETCLGLQGRWGAPPPRLLVLPAPARPPPRPPLPLHLTEHSAECRAAHQGGACLSSKGQVSGGLAVLGRPGVPATPPRPRGSWPGLWTGFCVLAAVFLDDGLPGGAAGHLPVLCVRHRHRGRAGRPPPCPAWPPTCSLSEQGAGWGGRSERRGGACLPWDTCRGRSRLSRGGPGPCRVERVKRPTRTEQGACPLRAPARPRAHPPSHPLPVLQPRPPAGADRGVRLPLAPPPEPPDRALRPPGPLPAPHPAHRPPGPSAVLPGRRLLSVLLPGGEWGWSGRKAEGRVTPGGEGRAQPQEEGMEAGTAGGLSAHVPRAHLCRCQVLLACPPCDGPGASGPCA